MRNDPELFRGALWAETVTATYGFELEWLDAATPVAVIDDEAGKRVIGGAFADYLPIDDHDDARRLLVVGRERFPDHAIVLKTRLKEPLDETFTVKKRAMGHRYYPGDGPPRSGFRRNVRTAEKAGVTVREVKDDPAAVDRFYQLHAGLRMAKFGSIPQPRMFFENLYRRYTGAGCGYFLEARLEGETCASFLVLQEGNGLFYKFGASHPDFLHAKPNNLLFQYLIDKLEAGKYEFLDLGLTGLSDAYAGLRRFKGDTGARTYPITVIEDLPPGYDTSARGKLLGILGKVTGRLAAESAPLSLVDRISGDIYRYFV